MQNFQYVGLGFRRDFAEEFLREKPFQPAFFELAPENWMRMGGYWKKQLKELSNNYRLTSHGLSLSIGSPDALDKTFLHDVRNFLERHNVLLYSEHLSYSKVQNAHLYDLLPIPFTKDAINHIVERIHQVQDFLKRPLVLENVSYYTPMGAQMEEVEFVSEVVRQSGCKLLLDVNNVFVNAFNQGYDARTFISSLPLKSVAYIHMAGHEQVAEDLIIDTHGQPIIHPVYELFEYALSLIKKPVPVLLERDFNIPALEELKLEMNNLESICRKAWAKPKTHAA